MSGVKIRTDASQTSQAQTPMISCKDCATLNSIDSAFCKKCGKPLAQEEALDARERVEKQLDRGFELFHHGRTDEAALIAETSLASDPTSLRGLSLRAMVLERRGLIAEALDCYETIVARDPNAALEKIKLQTLRGALELGRRKPQFDRRTALLVAGCVVVMVISVGGLIAVLAGRKANVVADATPAKPSYSVDSFKGSPTPSETTAAETKAADAAETSSTGQGPSDETKSPPLATGIPSNAMLPKPASDEPNPTADLKPLNPVPSGFELKPIQSQAAQSLPAPNPAQPSAQSDPDPSAVETKKDKPADPPPIVDIKLSDGGSSSGSDMAIDANGVEAMVRTARGQYQVGNYQAAAGTYERALRAGADPAMTNQRLGQCYERLGRTSDAKDAYSKAIAAIENAITSGKGDKGRLLAALESSRQALKNLQGG